MSEVVERDGPPTMRDGADAEPVAQRSRVTGRGRLHVFLGAAPGVGKTFAMLEEGWRLAEDGVEVLVGVIEMHDRPDLAARVGAIEVMPRRRLSYRGVTVEEMDLDALLRRRPAVVLVDELAHRRPGMPV